MALCVAAAALAHGAGASDDAAPEPAPPEAPTPLGASEAWLRERFGASLRPARAERAASVFHQIAPGSAPGAEEQDGADSPAPVQTRWVRPSRGDVQRVEYDLSEGRVYRVRWRLAERFERPVLDETVKRLAERLGRPDYDQTLRAKPGSERADLRRTGWTLGDRGLEIRQLHPFGGGPVFLSLSDIGAMQAIVDAKGVPLPQPETSGAWWRRPQRRAALPTPAERRELVAAIDALVAKLAQAPR